MSRVDKVDAEVLAWNDFTDAAMDLAEAYIRHGKELDSELGKLGKTYKAYKLAELANDA